MRRFVKFAAFWMIYCTALICLGLSCTEQQLRSGDRFAQDANAVGQGIGAVLESPVGLMIPAQVRLIAQLAVGLIGAGVITWQDWRNRQMKRTTRAIVKGIEKQNPDKGSPIKTSIALEMAKPGQRFYKRANKIVDRLKIS